MWQIRAVFTQIQAKSVSCPEIFKGSQSASESPSLLSEGEEYRVRVICTGKNRARNLGRGATTAPQPPQ